MREEAGGEGENEVGLVFEFEFRLHDLSSNNPQFSKVD
jgi:hypothetical protein